MEPQGRSERAQPRPAKPIGLLHPLSWILGLYLIAVALALGFVVLTLWPHVAPGPAGDEAASQGVTLWILTISGSAQIVAVAMAMGGLGSFLHIARSYIVFVGNGQLTARWFWWYLIWPFIGMALAGIVCFALHAGLMPIGSDGGVINPYGVATIAALVGMFAKDATEKLREIFQTLFMIKDPTPLADKPGQGALNPVPRVSGVEPKKIEPWSGTKTITVSGSGFIEASEVLVQGAPRRSEYVSPSEMKAHLLSEDTVSEGTLSVSVRNPPSGGGVAEPVKLQVRKGNDGPEAGRP